MKTKKLSTKHTPEELAEAIVFPVTLTQTQKKEAREQLAAARKGQKEMTGDDRLSLNVLQLKFQLEDYIQNKEFNPELTFGHFLKRYVINQHRTPPDYMAIRLEIHSNNSIPATYWFKLVEKQREHELKTDKELRRRENKNVHRKLAVTC